MRPDLYIDLQKKLTVSTTGLLTATPGILWNIQGFWRLHLAYLLTPGLLTATPGSVLCPLSRAFDGSTWHRVLYIRINLIIFYYCFTEEVNIEYPGLFTAPPGILWNIQGFSRLHLAYLLTPGLFTAPPGNVLCPLSRAFHGYNLV